MNEITLSFHQNLTRYFPGEPLRGTVRWNLDKDEKQLAVRLLWFTEGQSVSNQQIVHEHSWDSPNKQGEQAFEFTLPDAPHSFQGQLITLKWAVEVFARKNKTIQRLEFTLSPTGEIIRLPVLDEPV